MNFYSQEHDGYCKANGPTGGEVEYDAIITAGEAF